MLHYGLQDGCFELSWGPRAVPQHVAWLVVDRLPVVAWGALGFLMLVGKLWPIHLLS